jgi:hypothetical protein
LSGCDLGGRDLVGQGRWLSGLVELGHGAFGEVAAVGDSPLVVLLGDHAELVLMPVAETLHSIAEGLAGEPMTQI